MQERDPDGQAEPTIQTIQQEQSHKSTEAKEDETYSEQEEQPIQVPELCPILPLLMEGEEVEVEHLVEVLHQEEVWVEDV